MENLHGGLGAVDVLPARATCPADFDAEVFGFQFQAVKRGSPLPASAREAALAQVAELKQYFGVKSQCLETLLQD